MVRDANCPSNPGGQDAQRRPSLRRAAVLAFALGHPGFGPGRIAAELRRAKWGGLAPRPTGSGGCCAAQPQHPGQAPGCRRRLQRAPSLSGHRPAPIAISTQNTRARWSRWTASMRGASRASNEIISRGVDNPAVLPSQGSATAGPRRLRWRCRPRTMSTAIRNSTQAAIRTPRNGHENSRAGWPWHSPARQLARGPSPCPTWRRSDALIAPGDTEGPIGLLRTAHIRVTHKPGTEISTSHASSAM